MSKELTIAEAFDTKILPANPNLLSSNQLKLKEIAKEKANFIAQRIHSLQESLNRAQYLSAEAEYADDDGFFSRTFGSGKTATEKRSRLNTKVNTLQNEAIAELANLVQASIQFAATSAMLNQAMIEELSRITNEGFVDVYGDLQQLKQEQEIKYIKQIEYGLKTNQQAHKQGKLVSRNYELISQNQQNIKGVKILAWLAIVLSLVSFGVNVFSFLK